MTQKEFEERTSISMTEDDFATVHDIYMACGDRMDKDEFCALWKGKKFWELLNRVTDEKNITEQAYDMAMNKIKSMQEQQKNKGNDLAEFLLGKASAHQDTDLYKEAVKLVGMKNVVISKIRMGLPMWEEDLEYINKNLK